jgi:hypothetical protein
MDACRLGAHAARWVEKKDGLLRTPLVQAPGYCAAWSSTVAATAWCPSWITGAAAERRRRSNAQAHTRLCSVTVPWSGMHVVACYPDRHTGSARGGEAPTPFVSPPTRSTAARASYHQLALPLSAPLSIHSSLRTYIYTYKLAAPFGRVVTTNRLTRRRTTLDGHTNFFRSNRMLITSKLN